MVPTISFGGGSVCVSGGTCFDGRSHLMVLMNASLTSVRYGDMVAEPIIVPFAGAIGEGFVLIHDNVTVLGL